MKTGGLFGDVADSDVAPLADLEAGARMYVIGERGEVLLLGARSASSGVPVFPSRPYCPETAAADMEPATFGPSGTLYSFSTVHVSASRPVPYILGYVDFPGGLRTLASVRVSGGALRCDLPVVLCADGETWWVEPAEKLE